MKDNCFTILCWFLPCISMNQPLVYICSLSLEPPSYLLPHSYPWTLSEPSLSSPNHICCGLLRNQVPTSPDPSHCIHRLCQPWCNSINRGQTCTASGECGNRNSVTLPRWLNSKESTCLCRRREFDPWVGKILWRRKRQPTPVFLSGQSHGQRSLAGYSPWGSGELDTNEQLTPEALRTGS